ncbi:hypothetical protein BGW38_003042 [Lunasporangiospora selenospora]|uniref:RRM domain-containing protein n=1 Tax=Lunasporangiospora selenospora TaxID=979761 RepID=A0A9P6FRR4_9FUNG|nr:hypothetical protein BGW38_003042 [Lunasporangiospora selenospora]
MTSIDGASDFEANQAISVPVEWSNLDSTLGQSAGLEQPDCQDQTDAMAEYQQSRSSTTPPTPVPSPPRSQPRSPTTLLAKDMTHNVQSRAGSFDENEEMIVDMFGRSVPRSRHHSSDEGSDSEGENESTSPFYSRSRDDHRRRHRSGHERDYARDYSGDEQSHNPMEELDPYRAASRYLDTAFYPTKIYVGNLPSAISLTTLRTLFSPFGDIEDMNLVEGKDFGFVTYKSPDGAQLALGKMNGAVVEGTSIRVNRAKIPERNRRGFAGVAWMDEDGELARLEEEQHQQAAAIASGHVLPAQPAAMPELSREESSRHHRSSSTGEARASSAPRVNESVPVAETAAQASRSSYQKPRSPKLPPRPTGTASYPPVGMDPRAAMAATRGAGRRILRYDDL